MALASANLLVRPLVQGVVNNASKVGGPIAHTVQWPPSSSDPLVTFAAGTGANQIDTWYEDTRSLTSGGSDNIDLNGASFTDVFGAALAMLHLKFLGIYNYATSAVNLTVGNGTNPAQLLFGGTTNTIVLPPGAGIVHWYPGTGWPVTAATADILKILAGSGNAQYDIIAGGTTT